MADYPRYQISKFLDDRRTYQVVVRSDTYKDLQEAMKQIKPWIDSKEKEREETKEGDAFLRNLPDKINCKEHGVPMYLRDGKFGPYYSHKQGDGWCNLDAKKYKGNE